MEPANEQGWLLNEHPLKNHVILEQVFSLLEHSSTLQDWKNVRLVCKLWHDETLARFRSIAVLKFIGDTKTFEPRLACENTSLDFLTELQNPDSPYKLRELPYQRYKFARAVIKVPNGLQSMSAIPFWNTIGPSIKHLTLSHVRFAFFGNDRKVSTNLVNFLVEVTPNLETLKLEHVYEIGDCPVTNITHPNLTSVHAISSTSFSACVFPNLQECVLANYAQNDFTEMFLNYADPPMEAGVLGHSAVKRVDLMESKINAFTTPDIRFPSLEHFSVHLLTPNFYEYSEDIVPFLTTFVKNHRQTLKALEVFTSIDKTPPEVCPLSKELPVLAELRLWGNVVKNLSFLRFTPNLKLLHLDLYGVEKKEKMIKALNNNIRERNGINGNVIQINAGILRSTVKSGELTGVVLQKLEYFQANCALSPADVQNLGEWMPNLKTLKAVLNPETISAVCVKWPKLEHLVCLQGSTILDESVTGTLNKAGVKSLVDMKLLKNFEFNADCNASTLTDECVANGFLKMGELTRLQIYVSPKFSSEAENLLSERIQHVHVCRNYSANEMHGTGKFWECCENAKYKQLLASFNSRLSDLEDSSVDSFSSDSLSSESDMSEDSDLNEGNRTSEEIDESSENDVNI